MNVSAGRDARLLIVLAFAALALLGSWWLDARAVAVAEGVAARPRCVSYAPSSSGSRAPRNVTPGQLRYDFAHLAKRTGCIRTYTVSDGFDQAPQVAREFGLEVLLGLWIGSDLAHNEREIARGIDLARRHRETIRTIVVGNEVLLRRELAPEQLAALIHRVASATGLPVTYADVWGVWMKHRALSEAVSFVTVHILPYWDDDPVGIDDVIPFVHGLYREIQRSFPGKAVLVGETGWPSAGRPRGAAVPGRVNQARYIREFTVLAEQRGIDYNLIEAFDQPWKMAHEGTVGGHWGLYDGEGHEKFPWSGPLAEAPQGRAVIVAALVASLLGAGAGVLLGGVARFRVGLALAASAALFVGIAARQRQYLLAGNATALDWTITLAVVVTGWLAFGIAVRALAARTPVTRDPMPRALTLPLLLGCAYVCLGLVFAGRHRDFPLWLFLPGVLGIAITAGVNPQARAASLRERRAVDEVLLAIWLVAAGCLIPLLERLQNARSLGWGAASVLLGSAVLLPLVPQSRKHHGAAKQPDARPGEVVEHHAGGADREGEVGRQG